MSISFYRDFLAYDHWANRRVIESMRGRDGIDHPLRLLAHILGAQEMWVTRVEGGDYRSLEVWPSLTLDECEERLGRLHDRWTALLDACGDAGLDRVVTYTNIAGVPHQTSVRDILTHVNNHSTYHRSQIATAVKELGGTPAGTDFITYVWTMR